MTFSSPTSPLSKSGDLQTIIHDLSGYLRSRKQMGFARVSLSEASLEILAAWGRPRAPQKRFAHMGPVSAKVLLVEGTGRFFRGEAGVLLKKSWKP